MILIMASLWVQSHLIVIGIMGRSHFDGTCSKSRVDMVVCNDGNEPVDKRELNLFAD